MNIDYVRLLIDKGFNCIAINADKTPKRGWKDYQDKPVLSIVESDYYALICGYSDIECIDIDLKVLPAKIERDEFYNKLLGLVDDNIEHYQKKLVIKRTKSGGYHFVYKAKNIEGNQKLAKLTGYTEAIIETRGLGGYICMYDEVITMNYDQMQYITDEERNILISICRLLNEVSDEHIPIPLKVEKQYTSQNETSPWTDYNNKVSIFDIIGSDFTVVRDMADKTVIRRHGAKSPHSGYVFKKSGCMYLFSTGTIYEAQKLISPFAALTIRDFSGDFSRAASYLYSQGYGDRKRPSYEIKKEAIKPVFHSDGFPIDIFPDEVAHYLKECNRTLQNSVDYMGCTLLWIGSLVIGNSLRIEVKKGWTEISTIWMAIVGAAGLGKSPSINSVLYPLEKINGDERRRYQKAKKEYDAYMELTKEEKKQAIEVQEPRRTQFIVDDVTIEALINLHAQNHNGVGVFKDELAGWFKDMNKYKEGSDKEQWLSSWSGKGIAVDRITRQSDFIAKPILPVLGGIQPTVLTGFFTEENKDNGFLDRMLFTFPDLSVEAYVNEEIDPALIQFYNDFIVNFYQYMRKIVVFNDFGEIEPHLATLSPDANKEWIKIFNGITSKQNSDETPEMIKSMLAKQKSYIPRFALIINTFSGVWFGYDLLEISADSIKKAERLSAYFIAMNEKMILTNVDSLESRKVINTTSGSIEDKIKAIFKSNPEFNRSEIAKILNVSRKTITRYVSKIQQSGT